MKKLADYTYSKMLAKVMTFGVFASMLLTYESFIRSNTGSQSAGNWESAALIVAMSTTFILSVLLGDVYWVRIGKNKLDERQERVYKRVTLKSYRTLVIAFSLMLLAAPYVLEDFKLVDGQTLQLPVAQVLFYLLSLPSIFAAWEKDA